MFSPRPLDSRLRGNDGMWSLARLNATQGGVSDNFSDKLFSSFQDFCHYHFDILFHPQTATQ